MKQVELVRQRVAKGLHGELTRLRIWISAVEGNEEAVEKLRGKDCELLLATMTEGLLAHLGHTTAVKSDVTQSKARRMAREFTG